MLYSKRYHHFSQLASDLKERHRRQVHSLSSRGGPPLCGTPCPRSPVLLFRPLLRPSPLLSVAGTVVVSCATVSYTHFFFFVRSATPLLYAKKHPLRNPSSVRHCAHSSFLLHSSGEGVYRVHVSRADAVLGGFMFRRTRSICASRKKKRKAYCCGFR